MPLTVADTDFIQNLDPAAVTTRAAYGRQRRPFSPGYRMKASSVGAAALVGVNHPGQLDNTKCVTVAGAGAANNASPFSYTLPTGTGVTLPTTATLTTAASYADAWAIIYAKGDRANAVLLPRIGTGGANPTTTGAGFWRVETGSTLTIAANYNGSTYVDVAVNQIVEIIVPGASGIVAVWSPAAAADTILPAYDFHVASGTRVTLFRPFI